MNRNAKRQHHELARKRHRHELEQHSREAAKKPRAAFPRWLLGFVVGIVLLALVLVVFAS